MERVLFIVALVSLALAGCSAKPAPADDQTTSMAPDAHDGHDSSMHILAPTWSLGDWWSLTSPQLQTSVTHAIAAESGSDWIVDTDNPDLAFFNAQFGISYLGKAAKSDLAGSQGSNRVQYFDFPLYANKTWTTKWDGRAVTLTVQTVKDGVAFIDGKHTDGSHYVTYTFDSKLRYFGKMVFYAADGSSAFESTTTQAGTNFTGNLVRYSLSKPIDRHGPLTGGEQSTFTVPASITDVYLSLHAHCTTGAIVLAVGPPGSDAVNEGYDSQSPCPVNATFNGVVAKAPAQDANWGSTFNAASQDATLDATLFLRTLVTFTVGKAPPLA